MEIEKKVNNLLVPQRLPCQAFEDIRRKLVLTPEVNQALTRFGHLYRFAQKNQCAGTPLNGLLVFEGPPGSGKTMTAQALAQVWAERHLEVCKKQTFLFELHVPTIFSELLGKTSQAISEAFEMIRFSTERRQTIVIANETESLGFSRTKMSVGDPSDVARATNEFLKQIDTLKGNSMFLMIATTNLPSLIDDALTDRADYIVNFKNPDIQVGTAILINAAKESGRIGIRADLRELRKAAKVLCNNNSKYRPSGRLLSKLPLLAYIEGGSRQPTASLLVKIARKKICDGQILS